MAVREILRMGDPRLLEVARPVLDFATPALSGLIDDMFETMVAAGGVGLAAPQIGVGLQVVIFGFAKSERYPAAEAVPQTILINPRITPLSDEEEAGWEGCLSVPGLRGEVPRFARIRYQGVDETGALSPGGFKSAPIPARRLDLRQSGYRCFADPTPIRRVGVTLRFAVKRQARRHPI